MDTPRNESQRPWQVIAAELAVEKDTQRIVALSQELENALSEQSAISKPKPHSAQ